MITILYAPKVHEYLNNLIDILYENKYIVTYIGNNHTDAQYL